MTALDVDRTSVCWNGVNFAHERLTPSLRGEIEPLLMEHWKERAEYDDIPLDPDWDAYERMQSVGVLRIFTARDVDQQLIGYCVTMVLPHLHHRTVLMAMQDLIFIVPEQRRGGLGMALIEYVESALAAEGVKVTTQHMKAKHSFGKMLERVGYELMDLIYTKRLDKR